MNVIPFASPARAFQARKQLYTAACARVIDSGWYILGAEVECFERHFAAWLSGSADKGDVIGVGNGTDAIEIILRALLTLHPMPQGTRPAVFTVSHTAVATVAAVERAGCVPVLVDIDEASFTMAPASLDAALHMVHTQHPALTPLAVLPVHLYGHPADMDALCACAARYGLPVVEDCAQAHGALWRGRKVGTLGIAGAFSFYPTKNLGAVGDAGGVYTEDAALAAEIRALRQYGWKNRYISAEAGINSRMDPLQAAFLDINLGFLDEDNAARQALAASYAALADCPAVRLPAAPAQGGHVYHLYVIRCARRNALAAFLKEHGVGTAIHYPQPVHLQPAYAGRVPLAPAGLPVTEAVMPEILSLPMFPQVTAAEAAHVMHSIRLWAQEGKV